MKKLTLNALCIMFNGLMDVMPIPSQIGGLDTTSIHHPLRKPWLVRFWWSKLNFVKQCVLEVTC
jgi:hypothetical protein